MDLGDSELTIYCVHKDNWFESMYKKLYYYNEWETEHRQFVPSVAPSYLKETSNDFSYFITEQPGTLWDMDSATLSSNPDSERESLEKFSNHSFILFFSILL